MVDLRQGVDNGGQAVLIVLDGAHLEYGFHTGFHQELQLVKPVALLIVALDIQFPDRFDGRGHALMAGKQDDKELLVEFADFRNHLIAADRGH